MTTNTAQTETTETGTMKRIHAGRYEDGTYGILEIKTGTWHTIELAREQNLDSGWMQTYTTLRDAKEGIAWCHKEN